MSQPPNHSEADAVVERYARRQAGDRYSLLRPDVWQGLQERQRAILRLFHDDLRWSHLSDIRLVDLGCGTGGNLLDFLRIGFQPQNMHGLELLSERAQEARRVLPPSLSILEGDASSVEIGPGSQDIVFQSVVFSSLLDDDFQKALAARMWHWVKPGGGVLWYDFIYNNPANPDVRGVPIRRIRELFPEGKLAFKRVTLAPPISRRICRIHPSAYHLFNAIPWLRTHVLCWIQK